MQITCPVCHARYAIEAALADADARRAVAAAAKLPGGVGEAAIAYVGLFRPAKSALSWKRAARLLDELVAMVGAGGVARKGRSWKAGVNEFQSAFETVLGQREKLTLPLTSHGYLLEVLVGIADKAEGQAERATEARRRGRSALTPSPSPTSGGGEQDGDAPRASRPETAAQIVERRMRKQWDRELGLPAGEGAGD